MALRLGVAVKAVDDGFVAQRKVQVVLYLQQSRLENLQGFLKLRGHYL